MRRAGLASNCTEKYKNYIYNRSKSIFYTYISYSCVKTDSIYIVWLFADPYVKVWLMHKDKRVEKKKTITIKRCLNPVFNESFPFDIPAHVLRETTIIITVMDKDRLSRNDVIGKVRLLVFVWMQAASGLPSGAVERYWILQKLSIAVIAVWNF